MDPFIISSLEEIDIMGMGIADPVHVKVPRRDSLVQQACVRVFNS